MALSKQALIDIVEKDQLRTDLPEFSIGDTVVVDYKIKEEIVVGFSLLMASLLPKETAV